MQVTVNYHACNMRRAMFHLEMPEIRFFLFLTIALLSIFPLVAAPVLQDEIFVHSTGDTKRVRRAVIIRCCGSVTCNGMNKSEVVKQQHRKNNNNKQIIYLSARPLQISVVTKQPPIRSIQFAIPVIAVTNPPVVRQVQFVIPVMNYVTNPPVRPIQFALPIFVTSRPQIPTNNFFLDLLSQLFVFKTINVRTSSLATANNNTQGSNAVVNTNNKNTVKPASVATKAEVTTKNSGAAATTNEVAETTTTAGKVDTTKKPDAATTKGKQEVTAAPTTTAKAEGEGEEGGGDATEAAAKTEAPKSEAPTTAAPAETEAPAGEGEGEPAAERIFFDAKSKKVVRKGQLILSSKLNQTQDTELPIASVTEGNTTIGVNLATDNLTSNASLHNVSYNIESSRDETDLQLIQGRSLHVRNSTSTKSTSVITKNVTKTSTRHVSVTTPKTSLKLTTMNKNVTRSADTKLKPTSTTTKLKGTATSTTSSRMKQVVPTARGNVTVTAKQQMKLTPGNKQGTPVHKNYTSKAVSVPATKSNVAAVNGSKPLNATAVNTKVLKNVSVDRITVNKTTVAAQFNSTSRDMRITSMPQTTAVPANHSCPNNSAGTSFSESQTTVSNISASTNKSAETLTTSAVPLANVTSAGPNNAVSHKKSSKQVKKTSSSLAPAVSKANVQATRAKDQDYDDDSEDDSDDETSLAAKPTETTKKLLTTTPKATPKATSKVTTRKTTIDEETDDEEDEKNGTAPAILNKTQPFLKNKEKGKAVLNVNKLKIDEDEEEEEEKEEDSKKTFDINDVENVHNSTAASKPPISIKNNKTDIRANVSIDDEETDEDSEVLLSNNSSISLNKSVDVSGNRTGRHKVGSKGEDGSELEEEEAEEEEVANEDSDDPPKLRKKKVATTIKLTSKYVVTRRRETPTYFSTTKKKTTTRKPTPPTPEIDLEE